MRRGAAAALLVALGIGSASFAGPPRQWAQSPPAASDLNTPLLAAADTSLLVRHTDTTVLVIRSGKTTSGQISKAIAPLTPEKILGVVLNRADRMT